jgi:hypothetical protein
MCARAVLARLDLTLELRRLERMILDAQGKPSLTGLERDVLAPVLPKPRDTAAARHGIGLRHELTPSCKSVLTGGIEEARGWKTDPPTRFGSKAAWIHN